MSYNIPEMIPGGGGGTGSYACPAPTTVGDMVYLSGADSVDLASATSASTAALGIVIAKPAATTATVLFGEAEVAAFLGLTPTAQYYLSLVPGGVTDSVAGFLAGNIVQRIGQAKDAITIAIKIDNNFTIL